MVLDPSFIKYLKNDFNSVENIEPCYRAEYFLACCDEYVNCTCSRTMMSHG